MLLRLHLRTANVPQTQAIVTSGFRNLNFAERDGCAGAHLRPVAVRKPLMDLRTVSLSQA